MTDCFIFYLMVKITLLIILALAVVLIYATTADNHYLIYAQQTRSQVGTTSFSANGPISSIVGKFILAGNWSMSVNKGIVNYFAANISAALTDGTHEHYHLFSGFHQDVGPLVKINGNNTVSIKGTTDIGLNKKSDNWKKVPEIISIKNGTVISIELNDASKVYPAPPAGPGTTAFAHFTDPSINPPQPIHGLVKTLVRTYSTIITH